MPIDYNEKDAGIAGCTFYKNAVRWEIVSKSKLTSVEGHSRGCFLCFVGKMHTLPSFSSWPVIAAAVFLIHFT